jgi:3-mercaptopyruvate sulfurtransferase SseA
VRVVDMRQSGFDGGHVPGAVYLSPVAIRDANAPPTFLPTPRGVRADDGQARHFQHDAGRRLRRAGRHLCRAALVDPQLLRPHQRRADERRLAEMGGGASSDHDGIARAAGGPLHRAAAAAMARDRQRRRRRHRQAGIAIVDARTAAEIEGKDLRNIKRGGFIPVVDAVYWEDLLDLPQRTFKSADELKQIYEARGIVPTKEVIAYCQVGMRASVDLFALHLIGYDKLRNYLGSWEEWGNRDDLPIATKKP